MKRRPRPKPRARAAAASHKAEPLADARIAPLVERYCRLARVKRATSAKGDLHELSMPPSERRFFRDRERLRVAFSLDALERHPEAEIAVLGSPFLSQLLEAIRARAGRLSLGLIAARSPASTAARSRLPELAIPVRDGVAKPVKAGAAVHPIGRLIARVVLRAGATLEEAVVESDVCDLSSGAPVARDVADQFHALEARRIEPADASIVAKTKAVAARRPEDLLRLLVGNLREKSAERVAARRAAAEQQLAVALARLDRYFATMLADQTDAAGEAAVRALAERRRTEEVRRNQVRAMVHPLQLVDATVLIERAEWQLESRGHHATFSAQRSAAGAGDWIYACPHCGAPPETLVVCKHDHGACTACSHRCSVCAADFCAEHGVAQCRVDGEPACAEHARSCPSCQLQYCTAHEGTCSEDDHTTCSQCVQPCASCGRVVCNQHAEQTSADAPKGSRRLCTACVRQCAGGRNEWVGVDEVTPCSSCGKPVCTAHQAACAVDGEVHCARHLRRAEASRRLVCEKHAGSCVCEAATVFASDEVEPCPVCGLDACAAHRAACGYCGRIVCMADLGKLEAGRLRRCSTCARLAVDGHAPAEVIAAALRAAGEERRASPRLRSRIARDQSHSVVELDLGLSRKTVVALRHAEGTGGDLVAESVVRHSLLGTKRGR
jgi:hypothetical protein